MAAKTKCERLSNFRKCYKKASLQGQCFETADFNVLSIQRYLLDPRHCIQIGVTDGQTQQGFKDVIEVTVADYENKMKMILAPALNKLVQTTELQVGNTVVIERCKVYYDETDLTGSSIVIVEELQITGFTSHITDMSQLSWCDDCSHIEQMDIPLTSSRGYFVSVWSTMEMQGSIWKTDVPFSAGLGNTTLQDIYSIKDLYKKWSSVKIANPVVLVRVLMKSRLLHYAKPGKNDKWPFQAHMLIGDDSGTCTAVFWNATCPNFYHSIREGNVLLLKKFNMKNGFQTNPRFKPALKNKNFFDIDLNINSHHPETEVKVIDPVTLPDQIELPPLEYDFVNRRQAGCLPDNFICDIVGVVTYVGRYEREPMINKFGEDSGGFWVRRWLHLQDGSSNKPFCVQLYKMAEGKMDLDICPGRLLVCTHMRLVHKYDHIVTSHTGRNMFLTSTAESQISVLDDGFFSQLKDESVVSNLWKWSRSTQCETAVSKACIGGYYNYPPLPSNIDEVRECMKDTQVITSSDWKNVLTGFSYRECRQLLLTATIVNIKVNLLHLDTRDAEGRSPSKKTKLCQHEITLDQDVYRSDQALTILGSGHLDEEISFPVVYKNDQWSTVKQKLLFPLANLKDRPTVNLNDVEDQLEHVAAPYFTITWMGLNSRQLLQTHLLCPPNITHKSQLLDILSCSGYTKNPLLHDWTACLLPDNEMETVLSTANKCSDKRFMLVLDCYQADAKNVELFLNCALPLNKVG